MFSNALTNYVHTKAHTAVLGRPTIKDVERFRNGLNLMRGQDLSLSSLSSLPPGGG